MNKLLKSAGMFVKTLSGCLSSAWSDSDCHYHIPKNRFKGPDGGAERPDVRPSGPRKARHNIFLGSWRDCFARAWEAADREYNIPKSRLIDPVHNRTAYRSSRPGLGTRVSVFFTTLTHCVATAWKESDHYHHLPKSSYQDAGFVQEKMRSAPRPKGKLLYRPYVIGIGEIVGEGASAWNVTTSGDNTGELFIPPGGAEAGRGSKPDLEM